MTRHLSHMKTDTNETNFEIKNGSNGWSLLQQFKIHAVALWKSGALSDDAIDKIQKLSLSLDAESVYDYRTEDDYRLE